jgi:hypothetical protein
MPYCTIVEFEWNPMLASTPMPAPSRVSGFELASYQVA